MRIERDEDNKLDIVHYDFIVEDQSDRRILERLTQDEHDGRDIQFNFFEANETMQLSFPFYNDDYSEERADYNGCDEGIIYFVFFFFIKKKKKKFFFLKIFVKF